AGAVRATEGARVQHRQRPRALPRPAHRRDPSQLLRRTAMATFQFKQTTTATPEQFVAGLTDFGPGRAELFPNSADDYLKVHDRAATEADVTEGSGGVWERLHYDWSNPEHVVLTTTDSNAWGRNSGHTYNLKPQPDGATEVELVSVREGKNFKG